MLNIVRGAGADKTGEEEKAAAAAAAAAAAKDTVAATEDQVDDELRQRQSIDTFANPLVIWGWWYMVAMVISPK